MDIKDDNLYPIKEASKITGISNRTLSRKALKDNIRKIDGRYLFTGFQLKTLIENKQRKEAKHASHYLAKSKNPAKDFAKENDALKKEIEALKKELSQKKYNVADNERVEIFTNKQYALFETRLKEWKEQANKIKEDQELLNEQNIKLKISKQKIKTKEEKLVFYKDNMEFYKQQLKYKDKQNTRLLEVHEKMIEAFQVQAKDMFTRSVVDAKKIDWKK